MPVIADIVIEGLTPADYDAVRAACGWLDRQPEGGLAHLTWWEGGTCRIIDAWENEAAFEQFAETRLGPAMAQAGVTSEPDVTFHAAHEVYLPRALTLAVT
jgi:hypothetical protein